MWKNNLNFFSEALIAYSSSALDIKEEREKKKRENK